MKSTTVTLDSDTLASLVELMRLRKTRSKSQIVREAIALLGETALPKKCPRVNIMEEANERNANSKL
ncbi:MAG: ribbon-helix-helix protein, CopG family [Oligosphaeraceae bacterium]